MLAGEVKISCKPLSEKPKSKHEPYGRDSIFPPDFLALRIISTAIGNRNLVDFAVHPRYFSGDLGFKSESFALLIDGYLAHLSSQ